MNMRFTSEDIRVTGTLVWYYYICPREVWLMSRQLTADQDDSNLEIGRYIQETSYSRAKKEVHLGHAKIDLIRRKDGDLVVGEVKKSSRYKESSRMQLAFYLRELKQRGIIAKGELHFPEEKRKEPVVLDEDLEAKLLAVEKDILQIMYRDLPPSPRRVRWCRQCAYAEFCWA
jgi:CRISPR-associated exonuclease Cas4